MSFVVSNPFKTRMSHTGQFKDQPYNELRGKSVADWVEMLNFQNVKCGNLCVYVCVCVYVCIYVCVSVCTFFSAS